MSDNDYNFLSPFVHPKNPISNYDDVTEHTVVEI